MTCRTHTITMPEATCEMALFGKATIKADFRDGPPSMARIVEHRLRLLQTHVEQFLAEGRAHIRKEHVQISL